MLADVAVVIATTLRPTLARAAESVYSQDFAGRIHLLIGVDVAQGNPKLLEEVRSRAPAHVHVTVFNPGYSTSARHGGPHSCYYGGALRTILSFAASAPLVAYLDDDDWYANNHLSTLCAALAGNDWAWALSWYVNPYNDEPMCIDEFESCGPGAGLYVPTYGGFVRTSCLMLDKLRCQHLLHGWSQALYPTGDGEDRVIFAALLAQHPQAGKSGRATVYYTLHPDDKRHAHRVDYIARQGYDLRRLTPAGRLPARR